MTKRRKEYDTGSSAKGFLKLAGFVVLVVCVVPIHYVLRLSPRRDPYTLPRLFHTLLCRLVGLRVRVRGRGVDGDGNGPVLFVCNHSSYLDIPVLGSLLKGSFVAKSEVASWPFIGYMCTIQKTVFIERRSVRAGAQRDGLRDRLEQGDNLILFPEGTSSDGQRTLPFKSSLFSIVEKPLETEGHVRIQPVSLVCTEVGGFPAGRRGRPFYAWYGDMTLVKHVWDIFRIGGVTVDVILHNPVTIRDFGSRKLLSDYCQQVVARGVNQCVTGRFEKDLAAAWPNRHKPPS